MINPKIKRESLPTLKLMELREMQFMKARRISYVKRKQLEKKLRKTPRFAKPKKLKKWATLFNVTSIETCLRLRVSLASARLKIEHLE
jgi:hypothetical protein